MTGPTPAAPPPAGSASPGSGSGRPASERGTLWALGLGPGDPGLVTVRAAEILRTARVVAFPVDAGGEPGRAFRTAERYLDPEVVRVPLEMPMTVDETRLRAAWELAAEAIAAHTAVGRDVAYLCVGDTLLYGSFGYLLSRYDGRVEVIPGVISPVAAASVLRRPLVEGREPLTIVPDGADAPALERALGLGGSVVVMKPSRLSEDGLAVLADSGALDRAWVTENVTLPEQVVYPASAADLATLPYFSVVTVLPPGREDEHGGGAQE
jgi:precorrin-2/cobalt-factor-2 C20-methyltransferase